MLEQVYPPLIRQIKQLLPPSSWQWVLPALRMDDLIWESLCNFEQVFGVTDLSELIQQPDDCAPAALALKALKYPRTPQELRLLPLIPVEAPFRELVESIENVPLQTLSDAALLALNLRQKRHSTGSWNDWTDTLEDTPLTALVCLFGIIPDQIEYLQALLPAQFEEGEDTKAIQRLLKVILSNPAPFSVHAELIRLLLHSLSPGEQELLLESLAVLQPALAKSLPKMKSSTSSSIANRKGGLITEAGILNQIKTFGRQLTRSIKIFDQSEPDLKAQQLSQSIQMTAQAQALMLAKLAIISEMNSTESEAEVHWQNTLRLQPESETLIAIYLLRQACTNSARQFPYSEVNPPQLEPKSAILSFSLRCLLPQTEQYPALSPGDNHLATLAQNMLDEVESLASSDPFLSDQEIYQYFLALISQIFIQRGMYPLAQQTVSLLLRQKPNHSSLLVLMAVLLHTQGHHEPALNLLHLLEGMFSDQAVLKPLLAQSHAANHEWEEALHIWQTLSSSSADSQLWSADAMLPHYEMLASARFAGQEGLVVELCKRKLERSPQDGIFLSFLAETQADRNLAQRIEIHQQAIEFSPSEAYVWLAYARTLKMNDDPQEALDILTAADQTLPRNPFILSALGELYLELGQPSLALPPLKAAAEAMASYKPFSIDFSVHQFLVDDTSPVPFIETINLRFNADWGNPAITFDQWYGTLIARLGETLQALGHHEQARQVLEKATQDYPANTGIAHQLARLNMAEGKHHAAGQLLRSVLLSKILNPQAVVDFATCALKEDNLASLDEVIQLLQGVLESQPEHFEALTLLAKALGRKDRPEDALKLYDQILRLPQARQQPRRTQLAFEMSQTALQAAEYELALATLLECDLQNPLTQKALAETYRHLGLFQEAAQAAQIVRSFDDGGIETLIWYAQFLIQLAQSDASHAFEFLSSAIEALQQALELDPQRRDLQLALAEALYQIGDQSQAKEILLRFVPEDDSDVAMLSSDTELIKAAQYLSLLGEQQAALSCYERSLSLIQTTSPEDPQKLNEIYQIIADLYRQNQRYSELEKTLKQAMAFRPDDLRLFFDYLSAWFEANPYPFQFAFEDQSLLELINRFEHHLKRNPASIELRLLYGLFSRWIGESEKAIEILNQLLADLTTCDENTNATMSQEVFLTTLTELSRTYRSRAEQQLADFWLDEGMKKVIADFSHAKNEAIEFFCDWIEAALRRGEDCQSLLFDLCNKNPDHYRLIALMSLAKLNQGDLRGAKILFETVLTAIAEPMPSLSAFHPAIVRLLDLSRRIETLYTISAVAQRSGQWNLACELLNKALRLEPEGIRAHWERVRVLVLRAEYQQICQRLGIETNAPGNIALEKDAKTDFEASAQLLQQHFGHLPKALITDNGQLRDWLYRGQLAFSTPLEENLEVSKEQLSVEILGAYLLNAPQANLKQRIAIASPFQTHPLVQFCAALSMLNSQPQQAASLLENLLTQVPRNIIQSLPRNHWILSSQHFLALVGVAYAQALIHNSASNREGLASKQSSALQAVESSLEYYPDEANWHILAAQLAALDTSNQASLLKAIAHLEQALQDNRPSLEVYLRLAELYLAIQKNDSAVQILESAIALDEDNPQIECWLAKAYLQSQQLELAAQYAQSAMEKNPLEVDYLMLRGEIALKMGDAATALQLAEQALEQPAENPLIWSLFARALHAAGKTDDALRVLEQTIPLKAEFLNLHLERIAILHDWKGAKAALSEINTLLEAFPQSAILLLHQAKLLAESGEVEPAISAAQSALRQCHQSTSPVSLEDHAFSHRLLGELFYRSGHLDQAVYHLNEAINLLPNDETAYLSLADIYLSRGESERALTIYQRCLNLNAENSQAYFKAGVLYKELKDYPNAEQMLRQAARLEPNNLAIQRQLGAVIALNLIHTQRTKEKNNL